LIGAEELEHLERSMRAAHRLALALGQDETILEKIDHGELHPAMAAFGLWQNDPDLSTLAEKIADDRTKASTRPTIDI